MPAARAVSPQECGAGVVACNQVNARRGVGCKHPNSTRPTARRVARAGTTQPQPILHGFLSGDSLRVPLAGGGTADRNAPGGRRDDEPA